MVTLQYNGCVRLGIIKAFWRRKNIEKQKEDDYREATPDL